MGETTCFLFVGMVEFLSMSLATRAGCHFVLLAAGRAIARKRPQKKCTKTTRISDSSGFEDPTEGDLDCE